MNQSQKARISNAGDEQVIIQNELRCRIRLLAVIDLVQAVYLGFLTIRIIIIQRDFTGTIQMVTQLADLVRQLLDHSTQLIDLVRQLLVAFA